MSKIDRLAFGITALELIVFEIGKRSVRKRNREFLQRMYGVSTVDELIKKQEKEFYEKNI